MEQCTIDLGLMSYRPLISLGIPLVYIVFCITLGFICRMGEKSFFTAFIYAISIPITSIFIFMLLGGKVTWC